MVCPSARPHVEAGPLFRRWLKVGYRVMIQRDVRPVEGEFDQIHLYVRKYQGYAEAMNKLVAKVLTLDPECQWVVCAADDIDPDPDHTPEEIAQECSEHFREGAGAAYSQLKWATTWGVMQPTGDRFAGGSIDRICGSPWIGREFAKRMYQGQGPYFKDYWHMFVDEELQAVATKFGVLWQRPDLMHMHHHFTRRDRSTNSISVQKETPAHLIEVNSQAHWIKYQTLFKQRKAAGFPGSEPS